MKYLQPMSMESTCYDVSISVDARKSFTYNIDSWGNELKKRDFQQEYRFLEENKNWKLLFCKYFHQKEFASWDCSESNKLHLARNKRSHQRSKTFIILIMGYSKTHGFFVRVDSVCVFVDATLFLSTTSKLPLDYSGLFFLFSKTCIFNS